MKKIFAIFSFLLICLSMSSCTDLKLKKYSNEVTGVKFLEKLDKKTEEYEATDEVTDFVVEMDTHTLNTKETTYNSSSKGYVESTEVNSSSVIKYDVDNKIFYAVMETESYDIDPSQEVKSEGKNEYSMQEIDSDTYIFDENTKTCRIISKTVDGYVDDLFSNSLEDVIDVLDKPGDVKYYIDGEIFTVVITYEPEYINNDTETTIETCLQLQFNKNGFESIVKVTESNDTTDAKSNKVVKMSETITRTSVTLKNVKLDSKNFDDYIVENTTGGLL